MVEFTIQRNGNSGRILRMTAHIQRLVCGVSLLTQLACTAAFQPPPRRWPPFPDENFMHVGAFLQVAAAGRAQGKVTSMTQAKSLSRDEALLAAWNKLESYIVSLPTRGGGTVGELVAASPKLRAKLDALVHSAEIASTKWDEDGTAAVVLVLGKDRINSLFDTGLP